MIEFEEFTLENGLQVIVHEDPSVQIAVLNVLYRVGSRDEHPDKTGFAHLFEHLMFGGSVNIPFYDEPLQLAGGDNNAFTSNDVTNYYLTLPAANIETGFWLESDRMLSLAFSEQALEVQRKVVVEEFKQSYLNKPYGDAWLRLCPLSYQIHPYQWPTIGKDIAHIEQANLADVKDFFRRFYVPNNAVLVVAGKVSVAEVKELCEKWFAPIPRGMDVQRRLPKEPVQTEKRTETIVAEVPAHALYKTFRTCGRFDPQYYTTDLLCDVLGRGDSSRLYQQLVKEKKIFTSISSYVMGFIDPGMMMIHGRTRDGVQPEEAEKYVNEVLSDLMHQPVSEQELMKVKNQYESSFLYEQVEVLGRAMNLAYASLSGDTSTINQEMEQVEQVSTREVQAVADVMLSESNAAVLYYKGENIT